MITVCGLQIEDIFDKVLLGYALKVCSGNIEELADGELRGVGGDACLFGRAGLGLAGTGGSTFRHFVAVERCFGR